jgi:hypothetical protein
MSQTIFIRTYFLMLSSGILIASFAQNTPQTPPIIATLMPANAVHASGQYNSAGIAGMGFGAADLPFQNICANQVTKFPGKIVFDIKHYSGDGLEIFKLQIDGEEQQRVAAKKAEFEKKRSKIKVKSSGIDSVSPLKTESVTGGSIMYFDYYTDCSEGVKRSKPTVFLHGVGHNSSTAINIEVSGSMSAEAAKAAATEVLAKFARTDFTKLD